MDNAPAKGLVEIIDKQTGEVLFSYAYEHQYEYLWNHGEDKGKKASGENEAPKTGNGKNK